MTLQFILFFGTFFGFAIWSMWGLCKTAGRVHDALDAFRAEADATDDYEELWEINNRMNEYAKANCGMRGFNDHAHEVSIFIVTKAKTIRKLTL